MFNFGNKILACVQLQVVKIGNAGGKIVKTLHECRKPKHVLETSVDEQEKQYTAVRLNRTKPCPFCLFCFFLNFCYNRRFAFVMHNVPCTIIA